MMSQPATSTLWALAALKIVPNKLVWAALADAARRENPRQNAQEVANTVRTLAQLELQPEAAMQTTLCGALEREAAAMGPAGVRMTRSALQRLEWPVSDAVLQKLGMDQRRV